MADRDEKKLPKLNAKRTKEILADVYGTTDGFTRQLSLSSASEGVMFESLLESLKDKWDDLAPGFHAWFNCKRKSQFLESVIET